MTILHFLRLTKAQQWDLLLAQGKRIGSHRTKRSSYILYTMENFFVEVELDLTGETLGSLFPFICGDRLKKYVKK